MKSLKFQVSSFKWLTGLAVLLLVWGCGSVSTVAPGNDALVVRAEQVESATASTLNLIVTVDDANRAFFAANVPAFARFCDWLRVPAVVGTNTLPQGLALVKRLDDLKLLYKANPFLSNSLLSGVISLESTNLNAARLLGTATNSLPK